MTRLMAAGLFAVAAAAALGACSRQAAPRSGLEIEPGTPVTLQRTDGVKVEGRLVEVQPGQIVVETAGGKKTVRRTDIAALSARDLVAPAAAPAPERPGTTAALAPPSGVTSDSSGAQGTTSVPAPAPAAPRFREVTIPAGTVLPVEMRTAVSSDRSKVEDPVRATLRAPVSIAGVRALPAGTEVLGHVTAARHSGRVKGRAHVAVRFTAVDLPDAHGKLAIQTEAVSRLAPATKKQDAATIGGGAAGGAIIGGILGGGDGAAKGAAIGGAAGTGVVLSTRGKDVRLGPGTFVSVRLTAPLTVRVKQG
jgi:hypothetical protein